MIKLTQTDSGFEILSDDTKVALSRDDLLSLERQIENLSLSSKIKDYFSNPYGEACDKYDSEAISENSALISEMAEYYDMVSCERQYDDEGGLRLDNDAMRQVEKEFEEDLKQYIRPDWDPDI